MLQSGQQHSDMCCPGFDRFMPGRGVHAMRLLSELAGRRPLFPPGIELSPDEAEVVNTLVRLCSCCCWFLMLMICGV
jgi:hypothetical protein